MNPLDPKFHILPRSEKDIWPQLAPARGLGFVLYEGTAIALRLGHRQSVDFDFFSQGNLDKDSIRQGLAFMRDATLIQDERNTLTVLTRDKVKVSFFGGLGFGRYGEPDVTRDGVLAIASLDDLMALKVKVILQHSELKDYVDIAEMIKANVSLAKGLSIATDMFKPDFAPGIALKALVYFEEDNLKLLKKEIKKTITKAVEKVAMLPSVARISDTLTNR
ncbi:MAG: nucleotidyl transferase AbiEii/AbiGii toxin family protein [Chthoniobacteraceae bacterium]